MLRVRHKQQPDVMYEVADPDKYYSTLGGALLNRDEYEVIPEDTKEGACRENASS